MNNLSNLSDNIINFPIFNKINDLVTQDQLDNSECAEGTVEYHQSRGLDLFKINESLVDTKILTDNPTEIFKINLRVLMLDGHSNIWHLLSSPTNSKELIESRKNILDTINNLPIKLIEKIYSSRNNIIKLNSFGSKFDHFEDLKYIIDDLKEIEEKGNYKLRNDDNAIDSLIFAFDELPLGSVDGIRKMIPGHIQLIRNIPGDFFTKTADELLGLFEEANNFSLADLKKIYEKKDHEAFFKLRSDVEKFCKAYSHWDSVLIVAEWAQSLYIKDLNNTVSGEEVANNIRDSRFLLRDELDDFFMHFPNNLPSGNQTEVYSGGNGSGKSTWLKTRLMLQLFYQTYGKVPANDAKLMMRDQIIFVNRGGSGYGEDLSAFGNDIEKKLMSFLPNLQIDALIFLDEFGSTISEKEAYYLLRALNDYLKQYGAKIYMATHNELYINWANTNSDKDVILYNFQSKPTKDGEMKFSYKLQRGKDNAHTLNVFRAAGMPKDVLKEAQLGMLGSLNKSKKRLTLPYKDIVLYTQEEREKLKLENKGFAGFTRYNEIVKCHYYDGDRVNYEIVRKYKPLGYNNRPNPYYSDEDLFFCAHHPAHLDQNAPELSFDFMRYGKVDSFSKQKDSIFIPNHLKSKNIQRKNIYTSSSGTLASLTTWGLTSDTKELQERQKFFEEIGEWSYKEVNMLYRDINTFKWIVANFQKNWGLSGSSFDFDYKELSRFNKAYWWQFFGNIEKYIVLEGFGRVCEWFITLFDMEEKLGNLPAEYKESHKYFLDKLKDTIILTERFNRANERKYRKSQKEFKTSAELSEKVCERISETLDGIWDKDIQSIINTMKTIYQDIDSISKPIDILSIDESKRCEIISFLNDSRIFRDKNPDSSEYMENGFRGMTQVISALKGTGNLLKPLLDKLKSFNSVHAHQIANYIESFIDIPDVEDFLELVKMKRDNPDKLMKNKKYFRIDRDHGGAVLFELNGLVDIANQIKKLGWIKVNYNNTGEIDIKGMTHPGLEKSKNEQKSNDIYMSSNQSFDILEGATMGGKTVHLQSMQWIIRLAHSIGYVPAQSATLPCFDGLVYIDRILEDEEKKLSAGQNDAKSWSEIILKMRKIVREKSEKGRYWFAIDEMISSVPARFQKGLAIALLEELTSLGQKGQISIHNPELVSILLENNPSSYNVRHPEVVFNKEGKIVYTYKINSGRSVDKEGHFTAYSIETAEKMGLPKEIIDRAREYKNGKN